MKNIICLSLLIVFICSGCDPDLLNTVPNDRLSSAIYWQDETDAVYATNAIYNYLNANFILGLEQISDIAHSNLSYTDQGLMEKGIFNSETPSTILDTWTSFYTGIRAANYFLANVDKISTDNINNINILKGEVMTLRAYFYMNLVFLYGDIPLITTPITISESKALQRTTSTQIWDFIDQELTKAATNLPLTQKEVGRITKGAALALKARAMIYAGRYQESADAAKDVIDLNIYNLYPQYKNLFSYAAENNVEVILDQQFVKDVYPGSAYNNYAPYSLANSGNIVPLKKLVDSYEMKNGMKIDETGSGFDPYNPYANRDPRLSYSIFTLGDTLINGKIYNSKPDSETADAIGFSLYSTTTGFNVQKYVNIEDINTSSNSGINIILIRYAEVLLTYAEARIELNQIDQSVYDAINKVRQRADVNQPPILGPLSQEQLRKIVRNERLVELAFEGNRFFDIRRWRIAESVLNIPIFGMTYTDSQGNLVNVKDVSFVRNFDPGRDYLWPIPQREIDLNGNLTQNPNY